MSLLTLVNVTASEKSTTNWLLLLKANADGDDPCKLESEKN